MCGVDVAGTFKQCDDLFNKVILNSDYEAALRYYNCKGIISFVADTFGMKAQAYCNMIVGIVRSDTSSALADAMRNKIQ